MFSARPTWSSSEACARAVARGAGLARARQVLHQPDRLAHHGEAVVQLVRREPDHRRREASAARARPRRRQRARMRPLLRPGGVDLRDQLRHLDRLEQHAEGVEPHPLDLLGQVEVPGEQDDLAARQQLAQRHQQLDAAHAGQVQVEQHDVGRPPRRPRRAPPPRRTRRAPRSRAGAAARRASPRTRARRRRAAPAPYVTGDLLGDVPHRQLQREDRPEAHHALDEDPAAELLHDPARDEEAEARSPCPSPSW